MRKLLHPYRNAGGSGSDSLFVQFVIGPLTFFFAVLAAITGLVAFVVSIPSLVCTGIAIWLEDRSLRG